jgi:hypothetical protein
MYPQTTDTWYDEVEHKHYVNSIYAPIWRWRRAYTADFEARMDWCVAEYGEANHPPEAALFGDKSRTIVGVSAKAGDTLELDASAASDPDGDPLSFNWFYYPEPGTYVGQLTIRDRRTATAIVEVPKDAGGKQIHVVLEVTDRNTIVSLTSYRRIVIDVS